MAELTHTDAAGRANMVDVGEKDSTERVAVAETRVSMAPETLEKIRANGLKKGDVLAVARIAGIMAAKETSRLIPLCHPLALTQVEVEATLGTADAPVVTLRATARCRGQTGVEMEALTAATVAGLTVYDMAKAVDRGMTITTALLEKSGGRSGHWRRDG